MERTNIDSPKDGVLGDQGRGLGYAQALRTIGFPYIDESDDLVSTMSSPPANVQMLLYRVNCEYTIPFVELVLDASNKFFVCDLDETNKPEAGVLLSEEEQENFSERMTNSLRHFSETHVLSDLGNSRSGNQSQLALEIPKFKGFYHHDEKTCYALFDLSEMTRPLNDTCHWEILENIPSPVKNFEFWNLSFQYEEDGEIEIKEIHTRPIRVFGTNAEYLRTERPVFGYCFYFKTTKEGEFTIPHYLFLPPEINIFTIQKAELQNIAADILDLYDFSEYKCIHYIENGNLTWCIKNIFSFFPCN